MRVILSIVLLLTCRVGFGQEASGTQANNLMIADEGIGAPLLAFKWSPIHLLYYYPSVQFSMEHRLFKRINLQYEGGWIVDLHGTNPEYDNKRGGRVGIELRYYIPSPKWVPFYLATEFYYHDVRFDRSATIGYNCAGAMCDYYQYATFPVRNVEYGPSLKFGIMLFPGWRHNRSFYFDFNSGIAYRRIDYDYRFQPAGANLTFMKSNHFDLFSPRESIDDKMRFIIGLRLCYRIL